MTTLTDARPAATEQTGAEPAPGLVLPRTDATLGPLLEESPTPVLVDFWAPWCGPCRALAPVLVQLAGEFSGRLVVASVNIDENPASMHAYGIKSAPTLLLFKGGSLAASQVGAVSKDRLADWLNSAL